jgi:hypothetical protein
MLAWSSGADERVGFEGARLDNLLTQRIFSEHPGTPEAHLALVQALGCTPQQVHARDLLSIAPEYEARAARLLDECGIAGDFIVAMCGTSPEEWQRNNVNFADGEESDGSEQGRAGMRIEYSTAGISSVIEQGGRAAERVLNAGVHAVRRAAKSAPVATSSEVAGGNTEAVQNVRLSEGTGGRKYRSSKVLAARGRSMTQWSLSQWPLRTGRKH